MLGFGGFRGFRGFRGFGGFGGFGGFRGFRGLRGYLGFRGFGGFRGFKGFGGFRAPGRSPVKPPLAKLEEATRMRPTLCTGWDNPWRSGRSNKAKVGMFPCIQTVTVFFWDSSGYFNPYEGLFVEGEASKVQSLLSAFVC